jgi:endonuclease/exonuclease/phosphatase family metal-dependent hydrolase
MKKQIIIFLAVLSLASSAFGMAIPEAQPKGAYRFMTYNIRRDGKEAKPDRIWSNRAALVAGIITAANPDVIGIQEATENQITDLHAQLKIMPVKERAVAIMPVKERAVALLGI